MTHAVKLTAAAGVLALTVAAMVGLYKLMPFPVSEDPAIGVVLPKTVKEELPAELGAGDETDEVRAEEVYHILKTYGGFVAVFPPHDLETPSRVTGIRAERLRRADAEKLEIGITVRGDEALARLLEDFGS